MKNHILFNEKYPYKTELHAHTKPVSPCGELPPKDVVKIYASLGCHSLTITNHLISDLMGGDSPEKYAERYLSDFYAAKKAAEGTALSILLGVEIRFTENENDYLIYGVAPEDIEEMITLLPIGIHEFYKRFKNNRNLILQAHPFRKNCTPAPIDSIDGIEVFNLHPGHNSRVGFAAKHAQANHLLVSGGTDFHHPGHQGLCLLRTEQNLRDSYDLAEALKSKDFLFDVSGHLVIPYFED